jgi:hypothetical protein
MTQPAITENELKYEGKTKKIKEECLNSWENKGSDAKSRGDKGEVAESGCKLD